MRAAAAGRARLFLDFANYFGYFYTLFHRKQWLTLPDRELRDTCQRAIDPHAVTLSKDKKVATRPPK